MRVIAHRGLSGLETENTNAAFVAAANRSYYGIETDIHKTADGRFVVIHDADLQRVAGVDIKVEEAALSALQQIILFDKDTIDMLHSHGLVINCWTVDSKERAEELAEWGPDLITTNILE